MKVSNILKKIVALTLALGCVGGATACKKDEVSNDPTTVQFYYWKSGYGDAWLNTLVNNFNKNQCKIVEFFGLLIYCFILVPCYCKCNVHF